MVATECGMVVNINTREKKLHLPNYDMILETCVKGSSSYSAILFFVVLANPCNYEVRY